MRERRTHQCIPNLVVGACSGCVICRDCPRSPRTRTGQIERETAVVRHHVHPLLYLGVGMLGMLVLWMLLSAALGWFNTTLDDFRYGRPRTFQTDAWVGHNEQNGVKSHFHRTESEWSYRNHRVSWW